MAVAGVLTERAKRSVGTGDGERAFWLHVAGLGRVRTLQSVSGGYKAASGGSDMSFACDEPLEDLEDQLVTLYAGYGPDAVPYFSGGLEEPNTDDDGYGRTALAYGPFKLMSSQSLNEEVRYQGQTLEYCVLDLCRRARYPMGAVEIVRGRTYTVEEEVFTANTTLTEAIDALIEPAKFVAIDRPGFGRKIMPRPRAGVIGRPKAVYAPGDYPRGAFKPKRTTATRYARVTVYRRDEKGRDVVKATRPVANRGKKPPPANRTYWIPDFPGTQQEADQAATDTALLLELGLQSFSFDGVDLNPELLLYDSLRVFRDEKRRGGKARVGYDCVVDEAVDFNVAREEFAMGLSGSCLEVSVTKISDPIVVNRRSPGVLVTSPTERPPKPSLVTASSNEYSVNDLSPYTVDEVSTN